MKKFKNVWGFLNGTSKKAFQVNYSTLIFFKLPPSRFSHFRDLYFKTEWLSPVGPLPGIPPGRKPGAQGIFQGPFSAFN